MARILATALASCLLVTGCSVVRVDERRMEGPEGAIELKAIRRTDPDVLTSGYAFRVKGQGRNSGWISVDTSGPSLLPDLPPGPYTIEVRGKGISRKRFQVEVRSGVRTSIAVLRKSVKRNARIEEACEDVAVGTGKAVLYTVGFVAYAVIWLVVEGCTGDDEDDDETCEERPRRPSNDPSRAKGHRSKAPSGYSAVRRP